MTYPSTHLTYCFETRGDAASVFPEASRFVAEGAGDLGRELLINSAAEGRDGRWMQGLPSTLLPRYLEPRVLPQATLPELERKCHTAPAF